MSGATVTRVVKYIRKGDDAVNISVEPSTVIFTEDGKVCDVAVRVTEGKLDVLYGEGAGKGFACSTLKGENRTVCDGKVRWSFKISQDKKTFLYRFILAEKVKINHVVPFTVNYGGMDYDREIHISSVFDGGKGDRGAALRGPQAWNDLPVGYRFQSGAEGEEFLDVVLHKGNFFYCSKTHEKSAANFPYGSLSNNLKLWKLGEKLNLIATKIMLAQYALVKNLGVEAIEMKDSAGNVVLRAKDGKVECKTGLFENVRLSGFIYKKKIILTSQNISKFSTKNLFGNMEINFMALSSTWIEIRDLRASVTISFPGIQPNTTYLTAEKEDEIRSMIGTKFLIQNKSNYDVIITGETCLSGTTTTVSFPVERNECTVLECKLFKVNGWEAIYWEFQPRMNISRSSI